LIANALTGLRLLLVVPVAWACADPDWLPGPILAVMVALAIATDFADGRLARHLGTASPAGMLFDHATDFLFVTSALFGAALAGLVTPWLPLLIVIAFSQYVVDSYWLYRRKILRMSFLGRWNGVFYFVPVVVIAASRLDIVRSAEDVMMMAVEWLGWGLLVSTLVSIVDRAIAPLRRGH
jgi:phosphatidylglycerophosphate synthase